MDQAKTVILLIRHGENDWVESGRLAGRTPGVLLNQKGRAQAQRLAELLADQPIAAIYSSPLERCMETAQPLAQRLNLEVCAEPGALEVDYGEWRGRALKELAQLPEWQKVQHYPSTFRFPGGETLREVQQRALATMERLHEQHANQLIAVFSHGDVIRTTVAHYLGTPLDLFQRVSISTASVSVLSFTDHMPMVLSVNRVDELPRFEIKVEKEQS